MRVAQMLAKKWPLRRQYEQSYPFEIPFQALSPLELEDRSRDQQIKDRNRPCVPELTSLLQCFKDSDFNQTRCAESLKKYYACISEAEGAAKTTVTKNRKLSDVKRVRDLNQLEATRLLKSKPLLK